jgi:Flp pilus assembly protein TadD
MPDSPAISPAQQAMVLGTQAWQAGQQEAACAEFARAAVLEPSWSVPHGALGVALRASGQPLAAIAAYGRALAIDPDQAATLSNLGNALRDLGRYAEAEPHMARACQLDPQSITFAYNLGLLLRDLRRYDEALAILERVAGANPDNPEAQWDLALMRLYLGDYDRGFAGYEARLGLKRNPKRDFPGPRWDGGEVSGRTVLLTCEQGFGDALQFARYVPLLAAKGARVILECQTELMELFASLGPAISVIAKDQPPPPYDLWAPMASLAHLMGTRFDTIPAGVPYLRAPPRPNLVVPKPAGIRLNVGLVWAGKTIPRDRSWPLDALLPLLARPDVTFFSLQMGPRAADLKSLAVDRLLIDAAPVLKSFADTAAVMERMDLIITIDTATAHLAGALGRPVWVLLRYVSDWRWQDEPTDSPWYPTMRLFRQPDPADFNSPVAEMAQALRAMVA